MAAWTLLRIGGNWRGMRSFSRKKGQRRLRGTLNEGDHAAAGSCRTVNKSRTPAVRHCVGLNIYERLAENGQGCQDA